MKNLLFLLCWCSIFYTQAQDNWTIPGQASHPPASFLPGMATLGGDKVLEFAFDGGTWVYDLSDDNWTAMNPALAPTGRIGHVMAYVGGDKVLLFGGTNDFNNYIPNNETWVYDLSDNTWTLHTPSSNPESRLSTAMAYAGGDHAVLYGGTPTGSDTWVFDVSANTWTQMNPVSNPGTQWSHAMASLDEDRVLLFSGMAGTDGTWVYDLSDNTWTLMFPGIQPDPRAIMAMASLGGDRVLLYGGLTYGYGGNSDTWIYDYGDNMWTMLNPSFTPGERYGHAMGSVTTDHVLLFGGPFPDETTFLFTATPEPCPADICNGIDDDCDGVANSIDVCPGGDDNGPCNASVLPAVLPPDWICSNNNNNEKIKVCHSGNTICVSVNAVPTHLAHGDFLGPCVSCAQGFAAPLINDHFNDAANPAEAFTIYPNPSTGDFKVLFDHANNGTIHIIDHNGRVLQRSSINDLRQIEFNLIEPGLYFIQMINDERIITKKLTVIQ